MTMTKTQRAEQEKARETLRGFIKPGMTVYTMLARWNWGMILGFLFSCLWWWGMIYLVMLAFN
jgi:hypothetical protein